MVAKQNIDISKIIQRLELIKNFIALEEESEINIHISKLMVLSSDKELTNIVSLLEEKAYSKAMPAIETYINQHRQLTMYIDPEIEGLKMEAKSLEAELNDLSEKKADLEKQIYEFGVRHNNELGELILKILLARKKQAKGTPKEEETEKDYNDYSQEYETSKDEKIAALSNKELKELKKKYRQASKLCHPDVVSEGQKELAEKLFAELNNAYERNDLKRISEILENLENVNFFVNKSDSITEKQLMKAEIEKLRMLIKELKKQIKEIKESEAFKTISSISDWDNYFKQAKDNLAKQVSDLENGRE